jgi:hypothetical protein
MKEIQALTYIETNNETPNENAADTLIDMYKGIENNIDIELASQKQFKSFKARNKRRRQLASQESARFWGSVGKGFITGLSSGIKSYNKSNQEIREIDNHYDKVRADLRKGASQINAANSASKKTYTSNRYENKSSQNGYKNTIKTTPKTNSDWGTIRLHCPQDRYTDKHESKVKSCISSSCSRYSRSSYSDYSEELKQDELYRACTKNCKRSICPTPKSGPVRVIRE